LIGVDKYQEFSDRNLAQSQSNALIAGFSYKTGIFESEHDAFPKGLKQLKSKHKRTLLDEVLKSEEKVLSGFDRKAELI
jgi:hypothetical protein